MRVLKELNLENIQYQMQDIQLHVHFQHNNKFIVLNTQMIQYNLQFKMQQFQDKSTLLKLPKI